ncbi:MAG: sensor histidine kinase [Planctomycetota bacterium]|jgi:signal transduction histidine kinase
MEPVSQNARLTKGAYWLIKLRWIAMACVGVGTYFCSNVFAIELQDFVLYGIAILLALYNVTILLCLNRLTRGGTEARSAVIKKIINFQMSADLLILTALLHFSGGIENPFVFYFVFHMIIASILLSVRESYLQATFAVLLFGLLILLEYLQLISHHCLEGFVPSCLHRDGLYALGTFFVFVTTLYLVVYMTSSIAVRLKRAEQAQKEANILLREKDRIKDEYVLRVTHDIKQDLATIQACLGVVVNKVAGPLGDQPAEFINRAHTRTFKLTYFVNALLRLTQMRLSSKLEMDAFSLSTTIENAVAAVRAKAEDKSITLKCNVERSLDKIYGSRLSVEEAVTNLLHNAIKYTPANGTVEINAKNHGDYVHVEVLDTGIGIPEEEQGKVFDEFYRGSNAKMVEKDGTGLGLSIVKHIVERHGGQIGVQSRENNGTRFWLTLPKAVGNASLDNRGDSVK